MTNDKPHVAPSEAIAPSTAVAEVALRITSDLIALRQRDGVDVAQIEAMAMHNAAIAFLRPSIGSYGVARIVDLVLTDGDRIAARDRASSVVGQKRAAAREKRGAKA